MRLPRGIFVKLVTVFLLIGLVPFIGISIWTYHKARQQMTATVIEYWLVRQARETAARLDGDVKEMRTMIRSWADDPLLAQHISSGADAQLLHGFLERRRNYRADMDLLMLVLPDGTVFAESTEDGDRRLEGRKLRDILVNESDYRWIELSLQPSPTSLEHAAVPVSTQDWHVSPLKLHAIGRGLIEGYPNDPEAYAIGFAATIVKDKIPIGALVALFNWERIQGILDSVSDRFREPDDPLREGTRYPSGYPFLFASDRDTIIAHHNRDILGTSLSENHGLQNFQAEMGRSPYGSYRYEYPPGTGKIAGWAYTRDDTDGGFGWTMGVGINDNEIYGDVRTLRDFMIISGLIVTGMVILMAAVFSHRLTEPITRLIAYTETVARGDLDARVHIRTNDEIAVLADSFNKMAEDLKESSRRLIKAEKDAAWQEMARQVAHEIKNPLTPIMLSAQQLKQAHQDRHPSFDEILGVSVETIVDQCEGLRRIASDFASFARFPQRDIARHDLAELVEGAVDLYRTQAGGDISVACAIESPAGTAVSVDKDELRRVFLNLFNNAMEAMKHGGQLTVIARTEPRPDRPGMIRIEVRDTGRGISPDDRERLFDPYFSTRTGGTGLGLAICKRIINEYNGTIEVESELGKGSTFIILLPQAETGTD